MPDFLHASWENLIMANYAIDEEVLRPFLPNGVELDLYNGSAYVSLVGFMFSKTRIFKVPVPYFGTFEEINLRFYVKRIQGNEVKRGVVFINETIPYKAVARVANRLYKEHYISIPTSHHWDIGPEHKKINYKWKIGDTWNNLYVNALAAKEPMLPGSEEEFIFEHYYGYTKVSGTLSQEYQLAHPRWQVHPVLDYAINCNFQKMYGDTFAFLKDCAPSSVIMAEGSQVRVGWKRITF